MQFKSILTCTMIAAGSLISQSALAAPIVGDFRSNASGSWATTGNWQVLQSTGPDVWVAAPNPPTTGDNVYIWSGDTITHSANSTIQIDQLVVQTGATLDINASSGTSTLDVQASSGLTVEGSLTVASDGKLVVSGDGTHSIPANGPFDGSLSVSGEMDMTHPDAVFNVDGFLFNIAGSATNTFAADVNVGKALNYPGTGVLEIDGALVIESTGTFNFNSTGTVQIDGSLDVQTTTGFDMIGSGTLDLNGSFSYASGANLELTGTVQFDMSSDFIVSAPLTISGTPVLNINVPDFRITHTLTLAGTGTATVDIANGNKFALQGSSALMNVNQSVTFNYASTGFVSIENGTAEIAIANGKTATMTAPLKGQGVISTPSGTGTLSNGTSVTAASGQLSLGANVALTGSGDWATDSSSVGTLQFNKAHTAALGNKLTGNFDLNNCGEFEFQVNIETNGQLQSSPAGRIDVVGGSQFGHNCSTSCTYVTVDTTYGGC